MKKIFVILLILFVGLLVGCASKSAVVKDFSTSFENSEEENLIYVKDLNGHYWEADKTLPWPGYTSSFHSSLDLTDLTIIPEFWNLPENVTCENSIQRPIVGKIVNNTDKEYTFVIVHKITNTYPDKRIYKPDYCLTIMVPAHSTGYYVYNKPEMVSNVSIHVHTKNKGSFQLGAYGGSNIDGGLQNYELAKRIFSEIEASHCEEVIFNGEDDLDEYKNYINLVLPFEYNEEDLVSDWVMRY